MNLAVNNELDIRGPAPKVETAAVAEFTKDMAETLGAFFDLYAQGGVVEVEVTDHGLWLRNPLTGGRQFLGMARFKGVN